LTIEVPISDFEITGKLQAGQQVHPAANVGYQPTKQTNREFDEEKKNEGNLLLILANSIAFIGTQSSC